MPGPAGDAVALAEVLAMAVPVAVAVSNVGTAVVGTGVVGAAGGVALEIPGPTQPVSTSRPATNALPSFTVFTLLARETARRGCTDPSPSSQADVSSLRAAAPIRSSVAVSATRTNCRPASP